MLLIKLLLAHFLGDFVFQPKSWVDDKEQKKGKSPKLYLHILIHICLMILLTLSMDLVITILAIGILHYIIDLCKLSIQNEKNRIKTFLVDQIAHISVIVLAVNYIYQPIKLGIWISWNELLLITLTLIILTTVLSKTIKVLVSKWTPETEDTDDDSLKNAGRYIGMLERLFIFGFVVTNNIQAIGFLLAAKSVFRFGDLRESKDRKLTEYILIGTLLSFGFAILIGLAYLSVKNEVSIL